MSVSDIEEEMREIYDIELSTSGYINKVNQAAQEWQNRPWNPLYLIVLMDGLSSRYVITERLSIRRSISVSV